MSQHGIKMPWGEGASHATSIAMHKSQLQSPPPGVVVLSTPKFLIWNTHVQGTHSKAILISQPI